MNTGNSRVTLELQLSAPGDNWDELMRPNTSSGAVFHPSDGGAPKPIRSGKLELDAGVIVGFVFNTQLIFDNTDASIVMLVADGKDPWPPPPPPPPRYQGWDDYEEEFKDLRAPGAAPTTRTPFRLTLLPRPDTESAARSK